MRKITRTALALALAGGAVATVEDESAALVERRLDEAEVSVNLDADEDARSREKDAVTIESDVVFVSDEDDGTESWTADEPMEVVVAWDAPFRPRRAGPMFVDGYDGIDGTMLLATFDVEPYGVPYGLGFGTLPGFAFATNLSCELCSDFFSRLSLAFTIAAFVLIGIYCLAKFEDDDDAVDAEGRCRCCRGRATVVVDARALALLAASESALVAEGKTAPEAKIA